MKTKFGIIPLNKLIDHTFLKPYGTSADIKKLCAEAKEYNFKSVCIHPSWIPLATQELIGSDVLICTVIGFPLGAMSSEVKVFEAQKAITAGADEVDMVINIGKLIEGEHSYLLEEIRAVKQVCGNKILKVIFENCLLEKEHIEKACNICADAGADFVKTSTGFSHGGATFDDVKLMSDIVEMKCEVKAAGGIRSYEDLVKMVENGATRIGTSSGIILMSRGETINEIIINKSPKRIPKLNFNEMIETKKSKNELSKAQLKWLITSYVNGEVEDYQMSSMAMAILLNGMTDKEIADLTTVMMNSGDVICLDAIEGIKLDKHSTGGVGDKTSLVLTPICAAAGLKVAKMSGKGLGITGGTLDKLESIKGFNISLTEQEFIKQVKEVGCAIIGQTGNLVPADKKLYALRDVSGTVDSKALIVSSIMSKKLATGADAIVLDVKCGNGSFSKTFEYANDLAQGLVKVGKDMGRNVVAHITNMDEPLGRAVGNAVEVIEAVETLKANAPLDLYQLVTELAATMMTQGKLTKTHEEGIKLGKEMIKSGKALAKFKEMIEGQGGDSSFIDDYDKIWKPKKEKVIRAEKDGFVKWISAEQIGRASIELGAGRNKKTDQLDYHAGIYIIKQSGEEVKAGDVVAKLFTSVKDISNIAVKKVTESFEITDEPIYKKVLLGEVR